MNIKTLVWNANSIRNKKAELSHFLDNNPNDILLLSETWLSNKDQFQLNGFSCYRQDRSHGGVAILIKNNIPHSSLKSFTEEYAEALSIKIHDPKGDFRIFSLYISPNASRAQAQTFFKKILLRNEPAIFCGDFNAKHQAWNNSKSCAKGRDLLNLCSKNNLQIQGPNGPTNFSHRGDPSVLDFTITKNFTRTSSPKISNDLSSDHIPFTFTIKSDLTSPNEQKILNFRKANWKKFKTVINEGSFHLNTSFPLLDTPQEINSCVKKFEDLILNAAAKSIPLKKPYQFRYKFSNEVQMLKRYRNSYRNLYQRSLDPFHKSMMNQLNRLVKQQTASFNQASFSERIAGLRLGDESLFSFTKSLKKKNAIAPPLKKPDQSLAFSEQEKANTLASAFQNAHMTTYDDTSVMDRQVKQSLINLNSASQSTLANQSNNSLKTFATESVSAIIQSLKVKKAAGPDGVPNKLIRNLPNLAIKLLTKMLNSCLMIGHFPEAWKVSKVLAFPKPGKATNDPNNYRPISLLSCVGKILERLILNELSDFEEINSIFIPQQFGFRKQHSTVQQIIRITERISFNFNLNKSTGVALIDLEKAYDSVWHDGLIHKLIANNYPVQLIHMIQSYLRNRKAFVDFNGQSSDIFNVMAGVPQGSLLSPHLFNIFINDIPTPDKCELAMYADDTAIISDVSWKNAKCITKRMVKSTTEVSDFLKKWKIRLNDRKTEFIVFTKSPVMIKRLKDFPPIFKGTHFQWLQQAKYLGVTLDSKLTFKAHIESVIKRAKAMMNTLFCLIKRSSTLPNHLKILIYKSIIRPIMTYACPAFSNSAKSHFNKIQIIQNKILRMALNADFYTRTVDLHAQANIPTIRDYVDKLTNHFYETAANHTSPLVSKLGNYTHDSVEFRVKHRLPKSLSTT